MPACTGSLPAELGGSLPSCSQRAGRATYRQAESSHPGELGSFVPHHAFCPVARPRCPWMLDLSKIRKGWGADGHSAGPPGSDRADMHDGHGVSLLPFSPCEHHGYNHSRDPSGHTHAYTHVHTHANMHTSTRVHTQAHMQCNARKHVHIIHVCTHVLAHTQCQPHLVPFLEAPRM